MGLKVTGYRGINKLDALFTIDGEPVNPHTRELYDQFFIAYINDDFPEQAYGLEHKTVYSFTECEVFPVGSYRLYNKWREQLAKLVGYPAVTSRLESYTEPVDVSHYEGAFEMDSGPFLELVCFSDCDGIIGTQVSAKLACDFAEWDERAKATEDTWFYRGYVGFRKCFDMAADNGAVVFC